jgi:4-hydroxybenzoate polyprenyltransferase
LSERAVDPAGEGTRAHALPLCVDLDGTLVATDTLWESFLGCMRRHPLELLRIPAWLARGRPALKRGLARAAGLQPGSLPFRAEVVEYLKAARAEGRPVVLATASDRLVAEAVASHLGLFDAVLATDGERNLKGARKREALETAFGRDGFEYLGDSAADLPVWEAAGRASCVGLSPAQEARVSARTPIARRFAAPRAGLRTWLRALRVHQWVKNTLVVLPLVMGHRFDEPALLGLVALAFVALSFAASSVYLGNDLMDLAVDRAHPSKRRRPFAAGELSIPAGLAAAPLLMLAAFAISLAWLPASFTATLAVYLALNVVYTFRLKSVAVADVIFLAGLYSLRVLAGGFATGIEVSPWLIAFSLFFFLNLAFLKRYTDLRGMPEGRDGPSPGRDYAREDAPLVLSLGPASGYMATLVLALYMQSEKVTILYRQPDLLWLLVPLLVFWLSRVWMLAHRGEMTDDPVVFTTRDPVSWAVLALAAGVLVLATIL